MRKFLILKKDNENYVYIEKVIESSSWPSTEQQEAFKIVELPEKEGHIRLYKDN